ncbi:MAG: hypothetical protein IJ615_03065 [Bacteroidaceae bacterium]|nr:hypothetical protein [Bacteroidaceae bacterium]
MGRSRHFFFSLCLLLMLCACGENDADRRLADSIEQTWQLAEDALPEALARAEGLRDSVGGASERVRQQYDLLTIRLRDKCYAMPSSPDSARQVLAYFDGATDAVSCERACFYVGSAYRDLKDYPQAMKHFQRAVDIAAQSTEADTLIWQNALSQLRYLYMLLLNYEEELDAALQAVDIAREGGRNMGWYLMDAATAYRHLGDTLRCIAYCDRAYEVIRREHFPTKYGKVLSGMLATYAKYECYDKVDTLISLLQQLPAEQRPHNYELSLALVHEHAGRTDSAIVHYRTYYDGEQSLAGRYEASAGLQRCHYRKGDFRQAAWWGCRQYETNDSIIARRAFEETQRARDTYIYYRDKDRERALMQRDERIILLSAIVGLSLLSVVMGLLALHVYRKRRFREAIVSKDRELTQKDKINRKLTQIALMGDVKGGAEGVIERFRSAAAGMERVEDDAWKDLMAATEAMYPGFLQAVQEKMQGNLHEPLLRTICLLKTGMTPSQIAAIMDAKRQTVWNRIRRAEEICGELLAPVEE